MPVHILVVLSGVHFTGLFQWLTLVPLELGGSGAEQGKVWILINLDFIGVETHGV